MYTNSGFSSSHDSMYFRSNITNWSNHHMDLIDDDVWSIYLYDILLPKLRTKEGILCRIDIFGDWDSNY